MSETFDQRWANERLLDFALTFDAASGEMRELRQSKVSAQRIFALYPLEINSWIKPMRVALSNEAVARNIWLEGNTFDSYRHVLKRISAEEGLAIRWNTALHEKGDSIATANAAWNIAIFLSALERLAAAENWLELRGDAELMSAMSGFEDVMGRVLRRAATAL